MKPKIVYLVWDYWIDEEKNKVYAIYLKNNRMYLLEQKSKGNKTKCSE